MQNFFIKQGATLPILAMRVNKDSQISYLKIHEHLENCAVTFSMKDGETGEYILSQKEGGIILRDKLGYPEQQNEYYIYFKFKERDTKIAGRFIGEFKIEFFDTSSTPYTGTFIGPIQENLIIEILPSNFIS